MRIFIGSSQESKPLAESIHRMLASLGEDPVGWWDSFPRGKTFLEGLERAVNECSAGLFIASADDIRVLRGEQTAVPRDNVLLEFGWFVGRRGRTNVGLATLGDPKLPSDLGGLRTLQLRQAGPSAGKKAGKQTEQHNRKEIAAWLADTRKTENFGMHADLTDTINKLLLTSSLDAIFAVDVVGPPAWNNPDTYRYIAPQIRRYIDVKAQSGHSTMLVSAPLQKAIATALANARRHSPRRQPLPSAAAVSRAAALSGGGHTGLEVCRILLWSREELMSPAGECVVSFHEAFHIPLFFIARRTDHKDRNVDFILFSMRDRIDGFYGTRKSLYETRPIHNGTIPSLGSPLAWVLKLLKSRDLLLASDALDMLRA